MLSKPPKSVFYCLIIHGQIHVISYVFLFRQISKPYTCQLLYDFERDTFLVHLYYSTAHFTSTNINKRSINSFILLDIWYVTLFKITTSIFALSLYIALIAVVFLFFYLNSIQSRHVVKNLTGFIINKNLQVTVIAYIKSHILSKLKIEKLTSDWHRIIWN